MPNQHLLAPNSSLLQDEMLMQVVQVLEGDYPLGPSFMHALGSVVEAAVLHECNYFDVNASFYDPDSPGLQSALRESGFVRQLQGADALQTFPPQADADMVLEQVGADEDMLDFVADINWTGGGAAFSDIDFETRHCAVLSRMLDRHPNLFRQLDLLDDDDLPAVPDPGRLIDDGMTRDRLVFLEGQNHRLAAMARLSQLLGLNLYTNVASVPHQVGMTDRANGIARELYETLSADLAKLDDDVGRTGFKMVKVPRLARLVLQNARGDPRALAAEIVSLRERHRGLREFLTDHDERWMNAGSTRERLRLRADYDNAWQALVSHERRARERLDFTVWDLAKRPTLALSAVGDKLAAAGRRLSVVGRIRGIHAFWTDLLDTANAQETYALAAGLGLGLAVDEVWKTHQEMAAALDRFIAAS